MSGMVRIKLYVMMFLQFFMWGAWFATLSAALDENGLGSIIAAAYATAPIAAIVAPLFLGLIADRFFASEKVMAVLLLVGGALLLAIPTLAAQQQAAEATAVNIPVVFQQDDAGEATDANASQADAAVTESAVTESVATEGTEASSAADATAPKTSLVGTIVYWLILGHMLCYMPTLGLGNTIAFTHISDQNEFPKIRVWGTIGWIVAGLVVGAVGWSRSFNIFWLAGGSALLLGLVCFTLPNTPPPLKGKPIGIRSLLMLDAWKLLTDWNFLVFAICSTLICVPLAYYYGLTATFLSQTGFAEPAATMTLGQMSEIFFMLLIPFFFRRLGLKMMILIGMACWIVRYALFAFGAPDQITWMLLLAVAIHGICYDFFFVTGFMYTDQKAPKEIRGQAQSLLVFLTQGIGMFFGYKIMGAEKFLGIDFGWTIGQYGQQVTSSDTYVSALKEARGDVETVGFLESFTRMFTRSLPDNLDPEILSTTMNQWKDFWLFPSMMAAIIMVLFALLFYDKAKKPKEEVLAESEASAEAAAELP